MAGLQKLLTIGSMADSFGLYLGSVFCQRGLALVRTVLFVWLLASARAQWGLWGVTAMLFTLGGPLLALGANQSLARYVSACQARGTLWPFYRAVRVALPAIILLAAAAALACTGPITRALVVSSEGTDNLSLPQQSAACAAALVNAAAMAFYLCTTAFAAGLRLYRLASLAELSYSVAFTLFGAAALLVDPSALSLLVAHAACLLASGALAAAGVHSFLRQTAPPSPAPAAPSASYRLLARFLSFAPPALAAALLWQVIPYVSFQFVNRDEGKAHGALFWMFLSLSQPVVYLANAAWSVIYSHLAHRWESDQRPAALATLQTSCNAVCLAAGAVAMALLAASPLWVHALPAGYHSGLLLLEGLTLAALAANQFGLVSILARLHERPLLIALAGLVAGGLNVVLCLLNFPFAGALGAAWSAGLAMLAATLLVGVPYLLFTRTRLSAGTWLLHLSPALLLLSLWLPSWLAPAAYALLLAAAVFTGAIFSPSEKRQVLSSLRSWRPKRTR